MIQAANVAVRHDDRLNLFYLKTKIRHGGNHPIAITHVANKMVRIIWKMLTAKEPYESHNASRYARKMRRMEKGSAVGARGGLASQAGPHRHIFCNPIPSDSFKVARA